MAARAQQVDVLVVDDVRFKNEFWWEQLTSMVKIRVERCRVTVVISRDPLEVYEEGGARQARAGIFGGNPEAVVVERSSLSSWLDGGMPRCRALRIGGENRHVREAW